MDAQLFELALTHRSWAYENGGVPTNERLEFLGDAVLEIVITEHLYRTYPEFPEGRLARMRAALVSAPSLADVARSLDIGPLIKLGAGEVATGGADKNSILSDTMEALIGACYLSEGGPAGAQRLVHHLFIPLVERVARMGPSLDWKTSLQELCASRGLELPRYVISESGPDHDRRFTATVLVGDHCRGRGRGTTKRQAEVNAASQAFQSLSDEPDAMAEG